MLVLFILLVSISYAMFVFTSGSANPFVAMKAPLRRRSWRLGRALALSSLVAGSLTIFALYVYSIDPRMALSIYLILLSLFVIPSVIKFRKTSIWR